MQSYYFAGPYFHQVDQYLLMSVFKTIHRLTFNQIAKNVYISFGQSYRIAFVFLNPNDK
jgi:hypothetical protein